MDIVCKPIMYPSSFVPANGVKALNGTCSCHYVTVIQECIIFEVLL